MVAATAEIRILSHQLLKVAIREPQRLSKRGGSLRSQLWIFRPKLVVIQPAEEVHLIVGAEGHRQGEGLIHMPRTQSTITGAQVVERLRL